MIEPSVQVNCRSNDTVDVARHGAMQNVTPLGLTALHFRYAGRTLRLRWGVIEMSASLLAIVVDCHDPLRQAKFWAQALAYEVNQRNPGEFRVSDPAGGGASLYFMKVPEPKAGKNRLHLDLVTSGPMEAEVARLAEAGAEVVEVRQDPASLDNPDTWTVMRDPEGHEFCVSSTATLTGWA